MNATVEAAHHSGFARVFGQRLIAAEKAQPQGMNIARFSLVLTESATLAQQVCKPSEENPQVTICRFQQSPNRTSHGSVLDIFGAPEWGSAAYQDWQKKAAPAVQAALVKVMANLTSFIRPVISA